MRTCSVQSGILICTCVLILLAGIILHFSNDTHVLLELVHSEIEQSKHNQENKSQNDTNSNAFLILKDVFTFNFPDLEVIPLQHHKKHVRVKREKPGILQADKIRANNIKTNKIFAKHVTADVVKAEKVKAIVISIGKAFSVHKAHTPTHAPETLVLERDGPDPSDSSVTILLEREHKPISINGHPQYEKDRQKMMNIRKSLVRRPKTRRRNTKKTKPKSIIPILNKTKPKSFIPILKKTKPKSFIPIRKKTKPKSFIPIVNKTKPKSFIPILNKPKPKSSMPILYNPKPKHPVLFGKTPVTSIGLRRKLQPYGRKIIPVAKPVSTNKTKQSNLNALKRKQLIIAHWKNKMMDFQKRKALRGKILAMQRIATVQNSAKVKPLPSRNTNKVIVQSTPIPKPRTFINPIQNNIIPAPVHKALPLNQALHQQFIKSLIKRIGDSIHMDSDTEESHEFEFNSFENDIDADNNKKSDILKLETFERTLPSFNWNDDSFEDEYWYEPDYIGNSDFTESDDISNDDFTESDEKSNSDFTESDDVSNADFSESDDISNADFPESDDISNSDFSESDDISNSDFSESIEEKGSDKETYESNESSDNNRKDEQSNENRRTIKTHKQPTKLNSKATSSSSEYEYYSSEDIRQGNDDGVTDLSDSTNKFIRSNRTKRIHNEKITVYNSEPYGVEDDSLYGNSDDIDTRVDKTSVKTFTKVKSQIINIHSTHEIESHSPEIMTPLVKSQSREKVNTSNKASNEKTRKHTDNFFSESAEEWFNKSDNSDISYEFSTEEKDDTTTKV